MSRVELQRAYKFRLYPTEAQIAELEEWERGLRTIYNLAHEQRLAALGRPRGEQPRVDYYRQSREMTELVQAHPQLCRIVCSARQEVLRDLDKAWQRWRKIRTGRPRFKRRTDGVRVYLSTPKHWKVDLGKLSLAGMASSVGPIEIRQDRTWPGNAKFSSCSIVRDVDEWYATFPLVFTEDVEPAPRRPVGINRGAIHAIADSDGRVVDSPKFYTKALARIRKRARDLDRKVSGSRNRHKALLRLAKAHQTVRRQRAHWLHEQSAYYTTRYNVIGIEDISVRKIMQSPKAEEQVHFSTKCKKHDCSEPTHKRRLCRKHYEEQRFIPKRAVHRSILDVGWYEFGRQLAYKAGARGGRVVAVDAGAQPLRPLVKDGPGGEAGISGTCSGCGSKLERSASGDAFAICFACSKGELGDTNAATNVLLRAMSTTPSSPTTPKASIKIKGRQKRSETPANPVGEACGGDAPVWAPVETGKGSRKRARHTCTVEPNGRNETSAQERSD